ASMSAPKSNHGWSGRPARYDDTEQRAQLFRHNTAANFGSYPSSSPAPGHWIRRASRAALISPTATSSSGAIVSAATSAATGAAPVGRVRMYDDSATATMLAATAAAKQVVGEAAPVAAVTTSLPGAQHVSLGGDMGGSG